MAVWPVPAQHLPSLHIHAVRVSVSVSVAPSGIIWVYLGKGVFPRRMADYVGCGFARELLQDRFGRCSSRDGWYPRVSVRFMTWLQSIEGRGIKLHLRERLVPGPAPGRVGVGSAATTGAGALEGAILRIRDYPMKGGGLW